MADEGSWGAPGKRVLVTGVAGQDGWFLARSLLATGCEVHGLVRDPGVAGVLEDELPGLTVHLGELRDAVSLDRIVDACEPDGIVNLAGSTSVARSWEAPIETADVIGGGVIRLLSAAWALQERRGTEVRVVQASSAEIFGDPAEVPQTESTPHEPVTPYGAAKDFAHSMVRVYRRRGLPASNAILYNHESPRRPEHFVARKITSTVAAIAHGAPATLVLGNMDVRRDWGYAPDHVEGMARILRDASPGDYIVATGEARSVREFVQEAFSVVGIEDWAHHVRVDQNLYRPADPAALVGDASRLRALGWVPTLTFADLVRTMVEADLALIEEGRRDVALPGGAS